MKNEPKWMKNELKWIKNEVKWIENKLNWKKNELESIQNNSIAKTCERTLKNYDQPFFNFDNVQEKNRLNKK